MKYPVAIVFVLLTQCCFANSVEIEIEEVNETELYIGASESDYEELVEAALNVDRSIVERQFIAEDLINDYDNPFCRSACYDLYILFLNISIDKK